MLLYVKYKLCLVLRYRNAITVQWVKSPICYTSFIFATQNT